MAIDMNGSSNGVKQNGAVPDSVPEEVTVALAKFVVSFPSEALSPEMITKLKALLLDYLGVSASAGFSAESSPKFLAGISAFSRGAKGSCTVLTKGSTFPPQYAALLNGAWCHTYDFDDTHASAILHPGSSLVSAALAEAEILNASGTDLLLALAVGYEVACRLGLALGDGSYRRGFHNTGTVGLYGSIAAVSKLRGFSQQVVEDAFGLALSKAAASMQFLENGSWNKRLHPGFAAHDALLCASLAEAGVIGATKAIEGKYGLLHNYSEAGKPDLVTQDLGQKWTFLATACKPFPACRMTHGQLEMVGKMRKAYASHGLPKQITVSLPAMCFPIVGVPAPNKIQPECIVDAQFSSYFQVAASWVYGNDLGWAIYDRIPDDKVRELCRRVTCEVDESYRGIESRLKVVFEDGTTVEDEVTYPLGEPQRPFEWHTGVQQKFKGLAEPVYGVTKCQQICDLVNGIEESAVVDLMALVA
jgi:2-methylcitrate dehydratase PrpD